MGSLTQERVQQLLDYSPETGDFTWLQRPVRSRHDRMWNTRFAGKQAGTIRKVRRGPCYLVISIGGKRYLSHRLAWLYMTGELPPDQVDHEDLDSLNNRWKNLRSANQTENNANSGIRSDNTSGFKGVSFNKRMGRYEAQIKARGKRRFLGYFDDPEDASDAYMTAAKKHFGEFARFS